MDAIGQLRARRAEDGKIELAFNSDEWYIRLTAEEARRLGQILLMLSGGNDAHSQGTGASEP